ncbi:hypothetical protein [Nonomuraea sp. NPDC048901]|uniref:hypothetical protein n=1 Tax=Nonomuraea sp. NPDC048901 TaxID=3155627 RepID=UPI0033E2AF59
MTATRVEIWHCDATACAASAPAGTDDWFSSLYVDGCPVHAEIVAAHEFNLTYDTRGRGSRATTTVSLTCRCGWVPPSRWTQGSTELLISEHLAHVREVTTEANRAQDQPS